MSWLGLKLITLVCCEKYAIIWGYDNDDTRDRIADFKEMMVLCIDAAVSTYYKDSMLEYIVNIWVACDFNNSSLIAFRYCC